MQLTSSHQRSRISSQQIGEVISDLELIGHSNAKILFVVDPFEVIEFCFPIDPDRESNTNIEQLADDQAALFEVFYGRKLPTVLLPEYAEEITNHLDFVTRRSEEVYSKLELLESLTRKAELDSPESHKGNSELIKYFQSNFGVLLAVRMGIDSLGAERLRDVSMKLRMINEVEPQELMIDAIRTYRRSPLADYIYEYLMSDSKAADRLTVARRQGAALRDSRAIDFLLHLNKALERRSVNGDVGERRVFLYLSSAHRSRRVFLQEKVIQSLPRIAGHKHSLLRTKSQIFAYAFSKSRVEDESEERKRTIEHLGTYKVLVENLEEMESSPAKYTEAAKQDLLKAIKEREAELRGAHAAVENLGLFLRIKTYSKLFSDGDVRLERRKDASVGDIYAEVRALFKKASESQALEDLALQEMKTLQTQMALQSDFAARVPTALTIAVAAPDQTQEAAEEKSETAEEPCRIPSHVRIQDPCYVGIFQLLRQYSKVPTSNADERVRLFSEAFKKFCDLEGRALGTDAPSGNRGEHELVRCIFYLTLPGKTGGQKVNDHAQSQITDYPELKPEFCYLRCWALSNMGEYAEADRLVAEMIAQDASDPRFQLWQALNIWTWRSKEKEQCPYGMIDAIRSTLEALTLYEQRRDEVRIGLAHNNLAFYYSCDPEDPSFSVGKAREHLEKLKLHVAKDEWAPDHPEFFHTEANLLFQEFLQKRQNGADPHVLLSLWNEANEAITRARRIVNKPAYGDFKRKIKAAKPPKKISGSASAPVSVSNR